MADAAPGTVYDPDTDDVVQAERAEARDAAAAGTGRGNTVTAPHGQGGHRCMAHPARRLCSAWALLTGQDLDATTLVRVLGAWLGQPA
ncbi:hypothetical protein [Streptomyces sp. NPDC029554]|uniref:hypothetical protein n=1 Tax=Streptomyces sp. NPDC029554 TaxID=3155126 RepID=UPI0033E7B35E